MEKNTEKKISIDTIIKNYNMRSSDKLKREYLLSVIKVKPYFFEFFIFLLLILSLFFDFSSLYVFFEQLQVWL